MLCIRCNLREEQHVLVYHQKVMWGVSQEAESQESWEAVLCGLGRLCCGLASECAAGTLRDVDIEAVFPKVI
jgi:hypothetical protein